jgi:hypothetical protein
MYDSIGHYTKYTRIHEQRAGIYTLQKKNKKLQKSGIIHVGTFPIIKWLYRVMVVMGNRTMVV